MRKTFLLVVALPCFILAGCFPFFSDSEPPRVLVFSKTEGFRHASIEAGVAAIRQMAEEKGFLVEATEDDSVFNEQDLARYSAVVFLCTTGDILDQQQQVAFTRYIQAGGGFVGIHSATDTEYAWPWYGRLVGGYFLSHPGNPNVREGTVLVADATHPSTETLPATWVHTDEWYDIRDFNTDVTVLLNADETTYKRPEENPASEPRPIAWYHEFEGGRAFYTGLGHTAESYAEPLFLDHLWGGLQYALGDGTPLDFNRPHVLPEENRFTKTVYDQNLYEPMELDFLDPNRILFIERQGAVKIYDLEAGQTETIATMDVFGGNEEGLLGVAVDPSYAETNWIYVSYSHPEELKINLSRFVLEGSSLDMASEKVLLSVPVDRGDACCHVGGSVEFDAEGNLFFSVGDNTNPFASDGYAPIDERPGREYWDAQRASTNTQDLRGKILRIKPEPAGTYSIPEGNLYADPTEGRPEIYVMGNRNPFRISIDKRTGYLYWGEVGPDASVDGELRGPKGHDEVNQARQAGFFGWPYFVGNNKPYYDYDFAAQQSKGPFDPGRPFNDSPNTQGIETLPPAQPAFIWYPYDESPEFPLVATGGRNAMAGPVYYQEDFPDTDVKFPSYYHGRLFTYDWMRDWIAVVTMDSDGRYQYMERFLPLTVEVSHPIDMLFGPDGALYLLEYGNSWNTRNLDARLARIAYNAGNRTPQAHIAADPVVGAAPLDVSFSAASSVDFDSDALTFAWDFEGGGSASGSGMEATHTYTAPGVYRAGLTVTDAAGASSRTTMEILVGNAPPTLTLSVEGNQSFFFDNQTPNYAVAVTDAEDGSLDDGGIAPEQVTISMTYVAEGRDLARPVQGHQALMATSTVALGKDLIAGSDCMACHQENTASAGPSYAQVAEQYKGKPEAEEYLVDKIINGGGGIWGERVMAPHPQLTEDEVLHMVRYILSLTTHPPESGTALAPSGTLPLTTHQPDKKGGRYVVMASYTDQGGEAVGPLAVREMLVLHAPYLEAEAHDEADGVATRSLEAGSAVDGNGGGYIAFHQRDLTDVGAISAHLVESEGSTSDGQIQVRLDAEDGPVVGTFEITPSQGSSPVITAQIAPTAGLHDLYFTFEGNGLVASIDFFTLHHKDATLP